MRVAEQGTEKEQTDIDTGLPEPGTTYYRRGEVITRSGYQLELAEVDQPEQGQPDYAVIFTFNGRGPVHTQGDGRLVKGIFFDWRDLILEITEIDQPLSDAPIIFAIGRGPLPRKKKERSAVKTKINVNNRALLKHAGSSLPVGAEFISAITAISQIAVEATLQTVTEAIDQKVSSMLQELDQRTSQMISEAVSEIMRAFADTHNIRMIATPSDPFASKIAELMRESKDLPSDELARRLSALRTSHIMETAERFGIGKRHTGEELNLDLFSAELRSEGGSDARTGDSSQDVIDGGVITGLSDETLERATSEAREDTAQLGLPPDIEAEPAISFANDEQTRDEPLSEQERGQ